VPVSELIDLAWCAVHRMTPGPTPHEVFFCRDAHSLLVFDQASFVQGGRWADGKRLGASGPLDVGLDVVPAHARFNARADVGSHIGCTLLSIDPASVHDIVEKHALPSLRPASGVQGELLSPLTQRLRQWVQGAGPATVDRLYLESLCTLLLREVLGAQGGKQQTPQAAGGLSTRAQRLVRDFMHANHAEKIELKTLADLAGVSRYHFARAFKVSFGVPAYKYLTHLRVRKATEMLHQTSHPVTEIALAVGFSSSSEFAQTFRQIMGATPREYRRSISITSSRSGKT
jgi:AraC family transcriptional regulator